MDSQTPIPIHSNVSINDSGIPNVTTQGNHLLDCLTYIPSSALSATKLNGNENGEEGIMVPVGETTDNPYVMPPLPPGKDGAAHGLVVIQNISVKDGCVIGFMLALWFYSLFLMFRAWRRILNFSEDQLNRPEAATVLWRTKIQRMLIMKVLNHMSITKKKILLMRKDINTQQVNLIVIQQWNLVIILLPLIHDSEIT